MPKTSVSANAGCLPSLTRRMLIMGGSMVTASTALAFPWNPPAITPASASAESDAELMILQQQFAQALLARDKARHQFNRCEKHFFALRPSVPKALTPGRSALGRLLRKPYTRWTAARLRGLLKRALDRDLEREARAALPVANAFELESGRLLVETGLAEAEAGYDAAKDAVRNLCERIADTPARSLVGVAIKADVFKVWGQPHWWSADELDTAARLAAQVLDAVIAIAANASPGERGV